MNTRQSATFDPLACPPTQLFTRYSLLCTANELGRVLCARESKEWKSQNKQPRAIVLSMNEQ